MRPASYPENARQIAGRNARNPPRQSAACSSAPSLRLPDNCSPPCSGRRADRDSFFARAVEGSASTVVRGRGEITP
jgi:hypothetical protein